MYTYTYVLDDLFDITNDTQSQLVLTSFVRYDVLVTLVVVLKGPVSLLPLLKLHRPPINTTVIKGVVSSLLHETVNFSSTRIL